MLNVEGCMLNVNPTVMIAESFNQQSAFSI